MPASAIFAREFVEVVRRLVDVAEFLLDRLHLLVEVVLALALLHLRLHAAADALFHLLHVDLAVDEADQQFQPLAGVDRVSSRRCLSARRTPRCAAMVSASAARLVDAGERLQQLRRQLAVGLDVLLEQRHQRARASPRSRAARASRSSRTTHRMAASACRRARRRGRRARASMPSTSTLIVPSGSFSNCSTCASVPIVVQVAWPRGRRSRPTSARPAGSACPTSIARSSARIDLSRPTNSGITMCGNTTTSRSGQHRQVEGFRMVGHGISGCRRRQR